MYTDQVIQEVESALHQIGFIDWEGEQSIDEGELLRIVQRELTQVKEHCKNTRTADMARWRQQLARLPYHIVLHILESNVENVCGSYRDVVGYFSRDPTRKCHLIFRSLYISDLPSPTRENTDHYMGLVMRHVRHVSISHLQTLDKWMRLPIKKSIRSIEVLSLHGNNHMEHPSFCPATYLSCKSIITSAISDHVIKFKNLVRLKLDSNFLGADTNTIKQLPAHTLTSLSMMIATQEHLQYLSDAIDHLIYLKELHLTQIPAGDLWSNVAVALRNAPPTLRRLSYFQHTWNYNDNMRVKILPGMFSSSLAKSIDELHLNCYVGDCTGLAEFSRLKSLSMWHLTDVKEVQAIFSALRLVHSLNELSLQFDWEVYDKSFTIVLSVLTDIMNALPGLQRLNVEISAIDLNISDSALARFLADTVRSRVTLKWNMYEYIEPVSFSASMYRSFLTALLHPKLRHLLNNFYQDDNLYTSHKEMYQAVGDIYNTMIKTGYQI